MIAPTHITTADRRDDLLAGAGGALVTARGAVRVEPAGGDDVTQTAAEGLVVGLGVTTLADEPEAGVTVLGRIRAACGQVRQYPAKPVRPPLWDGHAAERIGACFCELVKG